MEVHVFSISHKIIIVGELTKRGARPKMNRSYLIVFGLSMFATRPDVITCML